MKKNQQGFTTVVIILVVLLLGLIGFMAWYIYGEKHASKKTQNTSSTQPATTPSPAKAETPVDETASWFDYNSTKGTYKVRIPDGWDLVNLREDIYAHGASNIVYKKGTMGKVTTVEGGWDGPQAFSLYVPIDYTQIVKQGTQQGTIKTDSGLTADKYYYLQETEPEALGYSKGSKVYNYYFGKAGKYIQIQYVIAPGESDPTVLMEKLIKTVRVN